MSTAQNHLPGDENNQQGTSTQQSNTTQEDVQISQPHVNRPEGPFKHSGETSNWTEEEKEEKEEQDQ